jgi:hypothetical protein
MYRHAHVHMLPPTILCTDMHMYTYSHPPYYVQTRTCTHAPTHHIMYRHAQYTCSHPHVLYVNVTHQLIHLSHFQTTTKATFSMTRKCANTCVSMRLYCAWDGEVDCVSVVVDLYKYVCIGCICHCPHYIWCMYVYAIEQWASEWPHFFLTWNSCCPRVFSSDSTLALLLHTYIYMCCDSPNLHWQYIYSTLGTYCTVYLERPVFKLPWATCTCGVQLL